MDAEEEQRRVLPVIEGLAEVFGLGDRDAAEAGTEHLISIDTSKSAVARAALRAGAQRRQ